MLYYDRIDVSEGIDINKTSSLKKCDICHYWHFFEKGVSTRCLQWLSRYICDIY